MTWPMVVLGDVARVQGGRTPKGLGTLLAATPRSDREIPFYKVGDMNAGSALRTSRTYLAVDEIRDLGLEVLPSGAVVFPKAGGAIATNKKRSVEVPGAVDLNCMAVIPGPALDARYLRLWFESFDLSSVSDGSVLPQISKKRAIGLQIPLPPVDEQRRVVAILEDHLSRLDAAARSLAVARRRVQSMEQAALAACRDGDLRSLGEVTAIQGGIQKQQKRAPRTNTYSFLRVANVTARGLDLDDVHLVELFDGELERLRLRQGDLLVVEGNGSASQIGRAALWDGSIDDCVHQNHLIRVRPLVGLLPEYLEAVWNSPQNRSKLTDVASSSSGLHTLSVSKLKALSIPVPTVERQHQLVTRVQDVRDKRAQLDLALEAAIRRDGALRRSLLAAAFSGRLTAAASERSRTEEMIGA